MVLCKVLKSSSGWRWEVLLNGDLVCGGMFYSTSQAAVSAAMTYIRSRA